MKWILPILFQVLAYSVGIAEVLVPSFGILSMVAIGLLVYSWYIILHTLPTSAAIVFGIVDLVALPFAVKFAMRLMDRTGISHLNALSKGPGNEVNEDSRLQYIGQMGTVIAALRPAGQIQIGDQILEARSWGNFLEKGQRVTVVSVEGMNLLVEPYDPKASDSDSKIK